MHQSFGGGGPAEIRPWHAAGGEYSVSGEVEICEVKWLGCVDFRQAGNGLRIDRHEVWTGEFVKL